MVSPAVFGGVVGVRYPPSASTIASSMNFWLGRTVLKERARALVEGQPVRGRAQVVGRSAEVRQRAVSRVRVAADGGVQSALLLRLCPILPIPLSGNWYVCGMTPLKFPEFFAAHFIGSSKTAFVDAYLGSLLLQAAFESDTMKEQAQSVLVFETAALVLISIGVTTYATDLFTQILEEEGVDAGTLLGEDEDEDEDDGEDGDGAGGAGSVGAIADAKGDARESPKRSPGEEDSAKWAAEAFVASAVAKEPKKESWWTRKDANDGGPDPEEQALLDAMDAAAASALAGVSIDDGRPSEQ